MPNGIRPRLEGAQELLDHPDADPRAVEDSLNDLVRLNRLLGGTRLTLRALESLVYELDEDGATFLDAACGAGDIAAAIAEWAPQFDLRARVIALDKSPAIAAIAANRVGSRVEVRVGDMLALDFEDDGVDVATCSLVIHHFEPPEAVRALHELARVARIGVVVNDLVRTPIARLGASVVARVGTRNPITRHDAVVSVRRAYTQGELMAMMREAGLVPVDLRSFLGYRVAVAAKAW